MKFKLKILVFKTFLKVMGVNKIFQNTGVNNSITFSHKESINLIIAKYLTISKYSITKTSNLTLQSIFLIQTPIKILSFLTIILLKTLFFKTFHLPKIHLPISPTSPPNP